MVVLDPIISHINEKIDPNSSSHVRQLLDALSEFAAVLVVVGHMAKGVDTSAVQKMAGPTNRSRPPAWSLEWDGKARMRSLASRPE